MRIVRFTAAPAMIAPTASESTPASSGPRGPVASDQSPPTTIASREATTYALKAHV